MFVFVFVGCRVSSVGRSVGWLDFFLVDALHEIEGICEKRGGWRVRVRVRVRVRLSEVEFVVVVGVRVKGTLGR